MKRMLAVFLSLCLVVCLLPVFASADTTHYLEELGISIDLPDDLVVFTRNTDADDPNLSAYGLNKDDLFSDMTEQNVYLTARDRDVSYLIDIAMTPSPASDFNLFSDKTLWEIADSYASDYTAAGITYLRSEIYHHAQTKFMKIYTSSTDDLGEIHVLHYRTGYNSQTIDVTIQSYVGQIDDVKEAMMKKIIDSIHFDTQPQVPYQKEASTYTDPYTGISFTVPANWSIEPQSQEDGIVEANFYTYIDTSVVGIGYRSRDFFYDTTPEEVGISRSTFDEYHTAAEIARIYGTSEHEISEVSYGGINYYQFSLELDSTPIIMLARCKNGIEYTFQFFGDPDSSYFHDFERMVNSVVYPDEEASVNEESSVPMEVSPIIEPSAPIEVSPDVEEAPDIPWSIIAVAVIALLVLIVVLLCRKKKQKAEPATSENTAVSGESRAQCPNCGCQVAANDRFCLECGTPLFPDEP